MSNDHRLFLLSNTNEMHMRQIFEMEDRSYDEVLLIPWFEKEYYSYKVGMRKPDPSIFQLVLEENSLKANETLNPMSNCWRRLLRYSSV